MKLLLISDIHANFPALQAVINHFDITFDLILNGGDTLVYAPFPNQTIDWLRENQVLSILGNTDRHIITLLSGKTFRKPRKPEKRIMYGWTAAELNSHNRAWLLQQPLSRTIKLPAPFSSKGCPFTIGLYHGSPEDPDEFLFSNGPASRFLELAQKSSHRIIVIGHSHSPFHRQTGAVHFINPGSVGRMFDGNPTASCAVCDLSGNKITVQHHRINYPVVKVTTELERLKFPSIYQEMYRTGRKLN